MKGFCSFLVFLWFSQQAISQEKKTGSLIVSAPERLDSIIALRKAVNEVSQTVPGYRVQLYFGPDRKKANEIKQLFFQLFPDKQAVILYQQPNYKVRAGDCRSRIEAAKLRSEILESFPACFVVRDEVALMNLE